MNLQKVNDLLLHRLIDKEIQPFLDPNPNAPRLAVALLDEHHQLMYGRPVRSGVPMAIVPVDMVFFPGEPLTPWLAGKLRPRPWQLVVSTADSIDGPRLFGGWLVAAVVLLILIAVICAVAIDVQARNLSRMQADFVSNVTHQLKTPLSLLSTAIETLCLGRVPPDRITQYLDILSSQTARMKALVERVLHFSRLDANSHTYWMQTERLNLVPLVQTVVDRFTIEARQKVPITFESPSATVVARADASAIEQAVLNLLENAVKYGDERNRVCVRVEQVADEASIAVRDHGMGIHRSDLPYIFEKFYRGRTGNRGRPGFGLGLALVKAIARAHRGRATVESDKHGGQCLQTRDPLRCERRRI